MNDTGSSDYDTYPQDLDDPDFMCPTCHGRGTVNPLTAPPEFFCVGVTDCPSCDGNGEI